MQKVNRFLVKIFILISFTLVLYSCGTEESSWERSEEQHTIQAYERFLKIYPDGEYAKKARQKIEELEFQEAESENTVQAYTEYLKNYPDGSLTEKAKVKIEELYFQEAESENTVQAYTEYLKNYPDGSLTEKAKVKIEELYFQEAESKNSIQAYKEFLELFPDSYFKDKTQLKLDEFYKSRHPELRDSRTAKIVTNASFPEGYEFQDSILRNTLRSLGLEFVESDEISDIIVTIDIQGKPLSAVYINLGERYSGAEVAGKIIFLHNNRVFQEREIFQHNPPERTIFTGGMFEESTYSSPELAPFDLAIKQSLLPAFLDIVIDAFGMNGLCNYIGEASNDKLTLTPAIEILARKWKEEEPWAISCVRQHIANVADPEYDVVMGFVENVKDFKDQRTVDLFVNLVHHKYSNISNTVLSYLGDLGEVSAIEPLMNILLETPDDQNNSGKVAFLIEALGKLTGKSFAKDRLKWERWWENNKENYMSQD